MEYFTIFISMMLVSNVVLSRFLGICSFVGVSKSVENSLGMGYAVIFVITVASIVANLLNDFVLVPLDIEYMRTIVFILVIAALVQLVEIVMKKMMPALYEALGVFLPLITTNCAVLGVAIDNATSSFNFLESLIAGIGTALGYTIAIVLLAGIRERTENNDITRTLQGTPIVLVTAGLMAIAFMGFSGMKLG